MLSASRGSLAKSSVQKASALHLLLLSRRWETLPPASPAGSQPWPPCPSASLGHKATFSQHLLTVVSLLRAVEESSGLENPGSLVLALRAGLGTLRSKAGAGLLLAGRERVAPGGFTAVAPGGSGDRAGSPSQRAPQGLVAEGPCSQGWRDWPSVFGFSKACGVWPEGVAFQVDAARGTGGLVGAVSAPWGHHVLEEKGVSPGVARSSSPCAVWPRGSGPL